MSTLSVIDLKWCHLGASPAHFFCCLVCGASAELNPLSHSGWKGGSCFCVHSPLTPALPQCQPWTVSETCLCTKGPHCSIRGSFVWKEATNPTSYFLFPSIFICITRFFDIFFFGRFVSSSIPLCTELGSFVCLCLCHRLAGVSPQSPVRGSECDSLGGNCFTACLSLPFCLSTLMAEC